MEIKTRFEQEQTAKGYEMYYDRKYKRTDLLEKKLLSKLFAQFPDVKSVLEVGCGTGHFTRWMASDLALECIGVDVSKVMLHEAKERWPKGTLLQSESSLLPLKDKSVDISVFITSMEFMPDGSIALKEALRIARKGIILGLMNKNSASAIRKRIQAAAQKDSFYSQAKFYSVSDIKDLLEKALPEKYDITFHRTTVFAKVLGGLESSVLPFGAFLGIAVKLRDNS
jgi:ubiquinone/menaquinone biosynthesis C-methylase UbiE